MLMLILGPIRSYHNQYPLSLPQDGAAGGLRRHEHGGGRRLAAARLVLERPGLAQHQPLPALPLAGRGPRRRRLHRSVLAAHILCGGDDERLDLSSCTIRSCVSDQAAASACLSVCLPACLGWVLAGDLSYATGYLSHWDSWMEMVEPMSRRVPLMVRLRAADKPAGHRRSCVHQLHRRSYVSESEGG